MKVIVSKRDDGGYSAKIENVPDLSLYFGDTPERAICNLLYSALTMMKMKNTNFLKDIRLDGLTVIRDYEDIDLVSKLRLCKNHLINIYNWIFHNKDTRLSYQDFQFLTKCFNNLDETLKDI